MDQALRVSPQYEGQGISTRLVSTAWAKLKCGNSLLLSCAKLVRKEEQLIEDYVRQQRQYEKGTNKRKERSFTIKILGV